MYTAKILSYKPLSSRQKETLKKHLKQKHASSIHSFFHDWNDDSSLIQKIAYAYYRQHKNLAIQRCKTEIEGKIDDSELKTVIAIDQELISCIRAFESKNLSSEGVNRFYLLAKKDFDLYTKTIELLAHKNHLYHLERRLIPSLWQSLLQQLILPFFVGTTASLIATFLLNPVLQSSFFNACTQLIKLVFH